MKTSHTLRWQTLVSKIHPPLPITARDSSKLLRLMQGSFQRHLDKNYPSPTKVDPPFANNHFELILNNPLLQTKPSKSNSRNQHLGPSIHNLQEWLDRPLDMFKYQISNGTASMSSARNCLKYQLRKCLQSSSASPASALANTPATSAMLDWLSSSQVGQTGEFLEDREFMGLFIRFLVAEQRYGIIQKWLVRLQRSTPQEAFSALSNPKQRQICQSRLLLNLVQAEARYGAGLEGAMLHFTQYFARHAKERLRQNPPTFERKILRPSGYFLSHALADTTISTGLSQHILNQFLNSTPAWAGYQSIVYAWQQAYRPDAPSALPGRRYIASVKEANIRRLDKPAKYMLIRLAMKVAEICLQEEKFGPASAATDFLKTHFANEIGFKPASRPTASKKAATSESEESLTELETMAAI